VYNIPMIIRSRSRVKGILSAFVFAAALMVLLAVPLAFTGCGGAHEPLVFAATADLAGSGILQAWVDDFRSRSGRDIELVTAVDLAVFAMVKHGECDVILTHLYSEEERLERSGYLEDRQMVMIDDYVLVGPPDDPAGVRETDNIEDALKRIADAQQPFVMRADGSGTANEESIFWAMSGVSDTGDWLKQSLGNMEETLILTSQAGAYTISDRSTYERIAERLELEILLEGGEGMGNPYYVAIVGSDVYPDTDTEGARDFVNYLLSDNARRFFNLGAWVPPTESE
jgi:tungstate transport system substrate-binding protein